MERESKERRRSCRHLSMRGRRENVQGHERHASRAGLSPPVPVPERQTTYQAQDNMIFQKLALAG